MVRADGRVEPTSHNEPNRRDPEPPRRRQLTDADPDPVLGGADAVEKSTYVADVHGADVGDREVRGVPVTASVSSGGTSPIAWIAGLLALLALAAYAVGLFT